MLFEIEPFGVNDAFLRLERNGAACVMAPVGTWNGLVRLDCLVAPSLAAGDPHMIFRLAHVGWDGDGFRRRGRASPVLVDPAMADVLCQRGLLRQAEANRLLASPPQPAASEGDEALMLRAALGGCSFSPVYEPVPGAPPRLAGYALRTLSDTGATMLDARDGLPVLDAETRARLAREFPTARG
jgi:hypothetical protein